MTAFKEAQDWSRYNETQVDRPEARELARKVLELAGPGAGRRAVDLGGGAGVETQAILRHGWDVLAIDYDPEAAGFAAARLTDEERARLTFRTQDFTEIDACLRAISSTPRGRCRSQGTTSSACGVSCSRR